MSTVYLDIKLIAASLGGEVTGRDRATVPGPGHSRKDRSLSIKSDPNAPDGFWLYSFANDDLCVCRDYVRDAIGAADIRPIPSKSAQHSRKSAKLRSQDAIRIWDDAIDPQGTLVEKYLRNRGLLLPSNAIESIRFHGSCPFGPGNRLPCMISLYRDITTDEAKAVLRTAISADGKKIDRKVLGPKSGCAVKFTPASGLAGSLTIGEGVETTLAGIIQGFSPAWCVGDAGALAKFPVIGGVTLLQILVDNDANGMGPASAVECGQRWTTAGIKVRLIIPEKLGDDMADLLAGRAAQ